MDQTKTKYRLVPYKRYGQIGHHLQFRCGSTWRYIPDEKYCIMFGYYLTQKSCPSNFWGVEYDHYWVHGEYFAKQYPDIEEFFKSMRAQRAAYVEREKNDKAEFKRAKIKYL